MAFLRLLTVAALLGNTLLISAELEPQVVTGHPFDCVTVTTYEALRAGKAPSKNLWVGTQSIYATTIDGGCLKLDVLEPGFETVHPSNAAALKDFNFVNNERGKPDSSVTETSPAVQPKLVGIAATPGCNQPCEGVDSPCLYPCRCRFIRAYANPDTGDYFEIYGCRG